MLGNVSHQELMYRRILEGVKFYSIAYKGFEYSWKWGSLFWNGRASNLACVTSKELCSSKNQKAGLVDVISSFPFLFVPHLLFHFPSFFSSFLYSFWERTIQYAVDGPRHLEESSLTFCQTSYHTFKDKCSQFCVFLSLVPTPSCSLINDLTLRWKKGIFAGFPWKELSGLYWV